ncbi:MAG: hypothetical protein IMF03_02160, partial [Proteobacteria bacterium]|nr:hypothetical protein [Pseudomonadota bacterium]
MLKYFLPLSRGSAWLPTLLFLGGLALLSFLGRSPFQYEKGEHLAYADQAGADALYLFPCDPGEFWQTMITLTNLENRKVEVDPFCYNRNGDFLGNSPSIESIEAEGTQTIKAEEIGVPGCQTFTLEADGKMVGALLLTSLDGEKSEAISAMHKSAKQLDFPPLLEGDTEDKTITLLNPGFSSANLEVIALDPDGGQLEQTFLPPLSSRESRTFAVKDLFSPESLYQLSTVRVISDNSIVGLQLVDSTPGDLVGLPALTSTSHKWSFPILTMGGDVELWTTVGLFNPGEVSAFVSIEAFDAEDASLGIIETTAFFPGAIYDLHTANMEGIIPQETAVLKVTADEPIIGYAVIGAVEGRGVTATLGIPAEDQMVAGFEIIGSADGSVLEAFPMIMTKNGVLKSTAENLGEEELRQDIEIITLGAPVQTLQKNKGATTDQESTAGFEETGAHVQDEDGEVFVGNSPPVPDSGATLSFKEDIVNEQEFSWTSSDPILGDIDTGGFVPATTWRLLGNNPTRLVFVGSGDGATFYGNVLFEPYNRAVVDVVKGRKRVRYLLKVAEVDLDINTHNHPKVNNIPVVSPTSEINDADEPREEDPGGYLWVNDDNDHVVTADSVIDKDDTSDYNDNDLEPLKYEISESVWDAGLAVEVAIDFPLNHVKIWQRNKNTELTPGIYTSLSDLDADEDGVLYLEGLDRGSGTIVLRIKNGVETMCEDTIKATVFEPIAVRWASSGPTSVSEDTSTPPPGQTRGGYRIFPDKLTQSDTSERDKPEVNIQLYPSLPSGATDWELPIYVRVFDVDHYHTETNFDPNGARDPNDNQSPYTGYANETDADGHVIRSRGTGNTTQIALEVLPSSVMRIIVNGTDTPGSSDVQWADVVQAGGGTSGLIPISRATVHLLHHVPCNNWRIGAGCGDTTASAIRLDTDAGAGKGVALEYINDTALNVYPSLGSQSSGTLTVWRRVRVESDHMENVDFDEGPTNVESTQDNDVTGTSGNTIDTQID